MKTFQKFKTGALLSGAGLVGSLHGANPGIGEINVELENGTTANLMTFPYLDTASSETRPFQNGKHWYKLKRTEYQLSDNIVLSDCTWLKSWDKDFNEKDIFNTSRDLYLREDNRMHVRNGKEIIVNTQPTNENCGGFVRIETDAKWPFTMISIFDYDSSYPVIGVKYDLKNQQAMNMGYYSEWYLDTQIQKMKPITTKYWTAHAPSKNTATLDEMVALTDGYTLNLLPKKNGHIMSVPGLTINQDVFYELAQIDVSNVQRRIKSPMFKQSAQTETVYEEAPLYDCPPPEVGQTPAPVQNQNRNQDRDAALDRLQAQQIAGKQREMAELLKKIDEEAKARDAAEASKRRPIASKPALSQEIVLTKTSGRLKQ
jgi:hypothetical protein